MKPLRHIALAATLTFAAANAHAQAKDWNVTEESDAILQTSVCRASTAVAKATNPVELSLSFPKDFAQLPIVTAKITGLANHAPIALIRFDRKTFQPMFLYKAATTPDEADIYWYPPVALPKLLDLIKGGDTLDIAFDPKSPTPIPVRFSLKGSSSTLDQAEKCLKVRELLPEDFLKALNEKTEFPGQLPPDVTAEATQLLVQQAYKDYLTGKTASAALAKLRKEIKPLTDKEDSAREEFDSRQRRYDRATVELTENQNELAKNETQLAQLNADLTRFQSEKIVADQDLAAKKAIYDPAKAQLKPYERDVDNREEALSAARRAIAHQHSRINNDEAQISQLQNEAARLRNDIASYESDLSSARSVLSRAESELNSYNVSSEARRILDNDWQYRSAKSDIDRHRHEAQQMRGEVSQAQSAVWQAQAAVNACQSKPDANCGSEQSALASANSRLNDCMSRQRNAESECSRLESTIRSCESNAESQARREYDERRSKRDQAASRVHSLESDLNYAENRRSNIISSEIPALQRDLSQARNSLPGLERQKAAASKELEEAKAKLAEFKAQIGFEAIEKAYDDARALAKKLAESIEAATDGIRRTTRTITKLKPVIVDLLKTQTKRAVDRDAAKVKLDAIQSQLGPQRQQEAVLIAQVDTVKKAIADARALYQAMVTKLSEGI